MIVYLFYNKNAYQKKKKEKKFWKKIPPFPYLGQLHVYFFQRRNTIATAKKKEKYTKYKVKAEL